MKKGCIFFHYQSKDFIINKYYQEFRYLVFV